VPDTFRGHEDEPDLATLLATLWHRRWWIALPLLISLAVTGALLRFLPSVYRAEAVVSVGPNLRLAGLVPGTPEEPVPGDREIDSLAGMLDAEPVRQAALANLHRQGLLAATASPPHAEIVRHTRTRLLLVRAAHPDPAVAAAFANALVEAFLAERRARLQATVREATAVLERQLDEVRRQRSRLEARTARLLAARLEPEGGALVARPESLAALEDELVRARAERAALEAELAALQRSSSAAPAVAGGGALERLIADRAGLERRRAELAGDLGPRHPEVRRLEREIAALDGRIAAERERLFALRRAELARVQERERQLAAGLARLRQEAVRQEELGRELDALRGEISALEQRERDLEARLLEARSRILLAAPALEWIERAKPPQEPDFPRPVPLFSFALAVGGGLGLLLVAVLELISRRVRAGAELERLLGVPVVAVPALPRGLARAVDFADVPLELPDLPPDAALRGVLVRIRPPAAPPARTVALLGVRPGEGTSALALALARRAALDGVPTVLVDGMPRGSRLRARLGLPGGPGLAEALAGGRDPLPLLCDDPLTPLRVLPASADGADPAPVADEAAEVLLGRLRGHFALVVVDVPAPARMEDGLPLMRACDVVVPVVRAGAAPAAVRRLAALLRALGVGAGLAVLLDVRPDRHRGSMVRARRAPGRFPWGPARPTGPADRLKEYFPYSIGC